MPQMQPVLEVGESIDLSLPPSSPAPSPKDTTDFSVQSGVPSPLSESGSSMFGHDAPSSDTSVHSRQPSTNDQTRLAHADVILAVIEVEKPIPSHHEPLAIVPEPTGEDGIKRDTLSPLAVMGVNVLKEEQITERVAVKKKSTSNLATDGDAPGTVVILSRPVTPEHKAELSSNADAPPPPLPTKEIVKPSPRQSTGDRKSSLKRPKSPKPIAAPPPPMPEQIYVEPSIDLRTGPKSFHAVVHGKMVQPLPSRRISTTPMPSAYTPERSQVVKVRQRNSIEPALGSPELNMLVAQAVQLEQRLGDSHEDINEAAIPPQSLQEPAQRRVEVVQAAVEVPPTPPPKEPSRFRSLFPFPSSVASSLGVKSHIAQSYRESWSSEKSSEDSTAVMTPPSPTFDLVTPPLFEEHRNVSARTKSKSMRNSRSMHSVRSDTSSTTHEGVRSPSPSPSGSSSSLWSSPRKIISNGATNATSKKGPSSRANSFVGRMLSRASRSSAALALPGNAPSASRSISPNSATTSRPLSRTFAQTPPPPPISALPHTTSSVATPAQDPTSPPVPTPSMHKPELTYDVPPPALRHLDESTHNMRPPSPNHSFTSPSVAPAASDHHHASPLGPPPASPIPPVPTLPVPYLPDLDTETETEHAPRPRPPRSRRSSHHQSHQAHIQHPHAQARPLSQATTHSQSHTYSSRPHSTISTHTTSSVTTASTSTSISIFSPSFDRGIYDAFPTVPGMSEPLPPLPPVPSKYASAYASDSGIRTGNGRRSRPNSVFAPIPIPIPMSSTRDSVPAAPPGPPPDIELPPTPPSAMSLFSALSRSLSRDGRTMLGLEDDVSVETEGELHDGRAVESGVTAQAGLRASPRASAGGSVPSRRSSRPSSWFEDERAVRS